MLQKMNGIAYFAVCEDFTLVPMSVSDHDEAPMVPEGCCAMIVINNDQGTAFLHRAKSTKALSITHAAGLVLGKGIILPVPKLSQDSDESANMYAGLGFTYLDMQTQMVRLPDGLVYSLNPDVNDVIIATARKEASAKNG